MADASSSGGRGDEQDGDDKQPPRVEGAADPPLVPVFKDGNLLLVVLALMLLQALAIVLRPPSDCTC